MSELTERLLERAEAFSQTPTMGAVAKDLSEAADRIEALERALNNAAHSIQFCLDYVPAGDIFKCKVERNLKTARTLLEERR